MVFLGKTKKLNCKQGKEDRRLLIFKYAIIFWAFLLISRLFVLQVLDYEFYSALASDQREIFAKLFPERGQIFIQDKKSQLYPLATNEDRFLVYADTRQVKDAKKTAEGLALILHPEDSPSPNPSHQGRGGEKGEWYEKIKERLSKEDDPFEPIEHGISEEKMEEIKKAELPGINFAKESYRVYPFQNIGSHVVGFIGEDEKGRKVGRYGLEASFEKELKGEEGFLKGERDVAGRYIPTVISKFKEAKDGQDLVLTIDRNIEYIACEKLNQAVKRHGADGGSVVIMEPKTGKILALCGAPDFDPNNYSKVKDQSVFNNPIIFNQYEPGSVFKVITMAAALDTNEVTPDATYEDKGKVVIGSHVITNSDNKTHGVRTMTQVLEESLNTGAIFAASKVGMGRFRDYVKHFGFGKPTGIELGSEAKGDIAALDKKGDIYLATASFGQGISITPLQLAQAFGAIANEGKFMKPYLVEKRLEKDKVIFENSPQMIRQVISPKTATLLSGMMTSVVENGHGKRAGVPGYFVAGKTGTAQIPRKDWPGYEPNATIGTFAGFAPVDNPRFVMVVRIDRPKDVQFAESTAAPLFGEIAQFLLQYMEVKPTRK